MSKADITKSFEFQRSVRPEIKSPAGHITMSFAPEDKARMSNDFMVQLAEEYMEKMGYKDTKFIIVHHHDNPNEHCHIIYNRIDNNGKLIADKNDYKRNEKVCKALKNRHNLTYGENKLRVRRTQLRGEEKIRYAIHDAILVSLPTAKSIDELIQTLSKLGVETELKYRNGTTIVQGFSFSKDGVSFKASKIDRRFSYANLARSIEATNEPHRIIKGVKLNQGQYRELKAGQKIWLSGLVGDDGKRFSTFVSLADNDTRVELSTKRIPAAIGGVKLTEQQRITLDNGKAIYVENATSSNGSIHNL